VNQNHLLGLQYRGFCLYLMIRTETGGGEDAEFYLSLPAAQEFVGLRHHGTKRGGSGYSYRRFPPL
jgi:hypothetical protein